MRSEVHRFPPFDHEELSYIPLHQHYYLKMKIGDVIVYFINRRWGIFLISCPNCERTMTSIPFANAPVGWIWSYKIIKATMTLMMNFSVSCCWIRPRSSGVSNIFWHTCIKSNLSIRSLTPRHLFNSLYLYFLYVSDFIITLAMTARSSVVLLATGPLLSSTNLAVELESA